jgi:hypothetical protein
MNDRSNSWGSLAVAYNSYIESRMLFFRQGNYMELIKSMLLTEERDLALELISILSPQKKEFFLEQLIHLGSFAHGATEKCWKLILDIPRDFVAKNIERCVDKMLVTHENYEVYRCLLTLCRRLEYHELVRKIALRALNSSDDDIREAGMDFSDYSNQQAKKGSFEF